MLVMTQAMIRIAHSATAYSLENLQDTAVEIFGPESSVYG